MAGSNIQLKSPVWYTGGLSASLRPGANQGDVIYLNGSTGGDGAFGRTPAEPVRTFLRALALCTNERNDTIVVLDYWNQDASFPIVVDKAMVSIIGVPGAGAQWPQIATAGNFAGFSVTALGVEICNLSINAGANHAGVEIAAAIWGTEIHHCWFGEAGTAQDGISTVGVDAVYLKVWACRFGEGLTRDGVRIEHNATRGMIGVPGLECNWFRGVGGVGVNITNEFAQGGIFDNRFALLVDKAGGAITLADGTSKIHVDGNSASMGEDPDGFANPYLDSSGVDVNRWGLNYFGDAATVPGT